MKSRSLTAQATMDRIVDATVAAIESGGEPALRVNDIARDSNVSVATLYHYFGDREGLVVAARVRQYLGSTGVYLADFARAVGELNDAQEFAALIKVFFDRSVAAENRQQRFLRAEILGSSRTRPQLAASLREIQDDHLRGLTEVFGIAKDRGFIASNVDPRDIAEFALAINLGSVIPDVVAGDAGQSQSLSRILPLLVDQVLIPNTVNSSAS